MSRLYEALQRADLERKTTPELELDPVVDAVVDPEIISEIEQPPPVKADLILDDIARYPWNPSSESFPTLADRGAGVEQFRSLRSRIYQARYEAPLKTILVSSGMPSEGKSFITANLAMNLARNSVNNILLIDADLRRPSLHKLLGAPNVPGLYEYLGGTAELKDILQRDRNSKPADPSSVGSISNLTFIPSGDCGDNSSELVANHRIEELIAAVSPHFDWILIDSPPVLAVTDAVELAHAADAVLLIARGARTPYDVAQRTQAAFSSSRILGFVLNDVKEMPRGGYNYYDYYGAPAAASRAK
jgi:capsular exopolysaccharide synthesis family protein